MGKKKNPKPDRNNKARDVVKEAVAEAKAKEIENLPVNKDFLFAVDEYGKPKYPIAQKLYKYVQLKIESINDIMRQVSAYLAQIKHHQNRIKRLEEQYHGEIVERDEYGRLLTKEEIQLKIVSEKIAIPRDIVHIREYAIHKLIPEIDNVRMTGEEYNRYIIAIEDQLKKLGYELVPERVELVFTSFDD